MICGKCQGLVIDDAGDVRCVNCGWRPGVALRNPDAGEMQDGPRCWKCGSAPENGRMDCRRCLDRDCDRVNVRNALKRGDNTMPRFKTEEGKQRWLAAMAKRRGSKAVGGGNAVMPVAPALLPTSQPLEEGGAVLREIDAAIVSASADVAALERAREIMSRPQRGYLAQRVLPES